LKITFVYPRFEKFLSDNAEIDRGLVDYFLGDFTTPPSLGIPIMASWTPDDVAVELVDDNSGDPVDFSAETDLVAINCFTPQATRAFELGDGYRAAGKKVIMGGFFPSFMVEECLKHADSVNVGEVEPVWQTIVEDARRGELKRKYIGGCRFNLANMRIPRRDIFYSKTNYDWDEDLVQLTRGCLYNCAMCAIPAHMGNRLRFRPIDDVIAEMKTLKYENVYLADDTLFFPQRKIADYSRELFKALIPLNKKYFVSSTMALNTDSEFLDLAAEAGVRNFYCTMNVDPISIKAIQGGKKEQQQLTDLVKMLEDREIRFFGSFAVGRDWDDESIAEKTLDLYLKANIHTSEFFLFTPYPGSVHWDRLERQGRIIDKNWSHYNGAHVVAKHPKLSVEALYGQFVTIWREFFRLQKERHVSHLEPATYSEGKQVVGKPLQKKGVRKTAVVTGVGVLSPIGNSPQEILSSITEARVGLAPITHFDASHFRTTIGGEIRNFNAADFLLPEELDEYEDEYLRYAIASARTAIKDSGIDYTPRGEIRRDIALVLGTCNGGLRSAEKEYQWKHGQSDKAFDEKMNLQAQLYGFGKALAHALRIGGETWVVTTACSSTTGALGLAQMLINRGYYKKVLIGGSDSLCLANMAGFNGIKAVSECQTAPFSLPEGLNVGEASCFWLIEEMESALLRSASCYGKIIGHSTTSDAYHPTSPDPRGDGVYRTMRQTLEDSGLKVSDLGYINAHGTGTSANDRAESKGITRFFNGESVPVVSLKSFFGHCMGTAGILEATCGLFAMNENIIPPTVNFSEPRPGCTLDYVPNTARKKEYPAFISTNYAFGGNNAGVCIAKWDADTPVRDEITNRVVITGSSSVTSLGLGVESLVSALQEQKKGFSRAPAIDFGEVQSKLGGFVKPFKASDIDKRINFAAMNPISSFATASAKLALDNAGLKVNRKNAEDVGIVMGSCNGPDEMAHMDSVFQTENHAADLSSFSNITANSTAGWVSNALLLKGINTTLSPGHHAGMQALMYAFNMLAEGRGKCILASAADEVYRQTYYNYNLIGFLYNGEQEERYATDFSTGKKKVLGEGAASLVLETMSGAKERNANILGEVLGYGQAMDAHSFGAPDMGHEGLVAAIENALQRSELSSADLDCIVWAPQGNAQDKKVLDAIRVVCGEKANTLPFLTSTFNAGYIEAASLLVNLSAVLYCLAEKKPFWPQCTGIEEVDNRQMSDTVEHLLVCGASDVGYNFAVIVKAGSAL